MLEYGEKVLIWDGAEGEWYPWVYEIIDYNGNTYKACKYGKDENELKGLYLNEIKSLKDIQL